MTRGLTLIEVLASVVLLSLVAVVCVPVFGAAVGAREGLGSAGIRRADLSALADRVVADPGAFDIGPLAGIRRGVVAWPGAGGRPPVEVRRLAAEAGTDSAHSWLRFSCDGRVVHRWIRIDADAAGEADGAGGLGL